ncbi:MAG: glycine zipper 2TM domain-containing protein [Sphingomonadaceae bacterium]|nr:glycine zipper 2TM domain-containing protein [Sphingomonadaceae bacterium]MCP5384686.1 glycine zipper 2TM domain-containing protein [Altererythrobacter sp.]MCP5393880.1 glycine zipper 2TM domain-containing protein [Sphingomonadaceae bacterium]
MTIKTLKIMALTLTAPAIALATPASAAAPAQQPVTSYSAAHTPIGADTTEYDRGRHRGWKRGRGNPHRYTGGYGGQQRYLGEPVYRSTRVWRGRDGEYYCRKQDGTTGLLIGAGVGALIGNELAGRGDRTLGAILGAAGGALLGREIDRSNARCR